MTMFWQHLCPRVHRQVQETCTPVSLSIPSFQAVQTFFVTCRFEGNIAAVRMALSMDDIADAQTEVEVYHCLQQLQGKHVPQLLGYGQSRQGFCVATSYIQVCGAHC